MFNFIENFKCDKDKIAELIKTDKSALDAFEKSYKEHILTNDSSEDFFDVTAKHAAEQHAGVETDERVYSVINRIVEELINITPVMEYDGKNISIYPAIGKKIENPVTNEELSQLPEEIRPWLTGTLMKVDIKALSYKALLDFWLHYTKEKNHRKKMEFYNLFRQGLDILDLDNITYQMIDQNPCSMGHWLPQLVEAVHLQDFFKVPKTTIIKVPCSLLQLSRLEYTMLNRTTLDIIDRFCYKIFRLNENKEYFIKTGIFSSKYDFRNAYVHDPKEVRELGEYLLFIHHQGVMMASPLTKPCFYGVATTTEWVVREFISDKEDNPCIYNGLPLHTEYRLFVDFDTKKVIGMNPYWDPKVMKKRFGEENDSDRPKNIHDYIIYTAHEETLMERYNQNKDKVWNNIQELIENMNDIEEQWSLDVMQNGNDFWIIDMAPAALSALNECVPKELLKPYIEENWIPEKIEI